MTLKAHTRLLMIAMFLLVGYVLGEFVFLAVAPWLYITISGILFCLILWLVFRFFRFTPSSTYSFSTRFCCSLVLLLSGFILNARTQPANISLASVTNESIIARLEGEIVELKHIDSTYKRCVFRGIIDPQTDNPFVGTVLLTIPQTKNAITLYSGNIISCDVQLRLPQQRILPTEFSEAQYARSEGIQFFGTAYAGNFSLLQESSSWFSYVEQIRSTLYNQIDRIYGSNHSAYIKALLLGDKRNIDTSIRKEFALSGTAHILAFSGLHIAVLSLFIIFIVRLYPIPPTLSLLLVTVCIGIIVLLSSAQPSSQRAGLAMILIWAMSQFQRRTQPLAVFLSIGIILIVFNPLLVFSVGFQLSFMAVLGIVLFQERFNSVLTKASVVNNPNNLVKSIISGLSMSLSASIFVAPLVGWYFCLNSLVSIFSNLIIIPLSSTILIGIVVNSVVELISLSLSRYCADSINTLLDLMIQINRYFAHQQYSTIAFPNQGFVALIGGLISVCTVYIVGGYALHSGANEVKLPSNNHILANRWFQKNSINYFIDNISQKQLFLTIIFRGCLSLVVCYTFFVVIIFSTKTNETYQRKKYVVELKQTLPQYVTLSIKENTAKKLRTMTYDNALEDFIVYHYADTVLLETSDIHLRSFADSLKSALSKHSSKVVIHNRLPLSSSP